MIVIIIMNIHEDRASRHKEKEGMIAIGVGISQDIGKRSTMEDEQAV
jgi:hypothetical protein